MKRIFCIVLLNLIGAHLLPASGQAATVRALSLADLTTRSAVVVRGTAQTIETHRDEKGRIVRRVSYAVREYLVGSGPKTRFIRLQGGELEGIGRKVPGEIDLKIGQETVLFLEQIPHLDRSMRIVGLNQGRFLVRRDETTSKLWVYRPLGSVNMTGTPRNDTHNIGQNTTPISIRFTDFVAAVRKIKYVK